MSGPPHRVRREWKHRRWSLHLGLELLLCFVLRISSFLFVSPAPFALRLGCMVLLVFPGCSAEPASRSASPPKAADSGVFDAQVRSVRDGQTDWIAVETEEISDEQLQQVQDLTPLRELLLEQTCITDAGLDQLASLTQLEHLRLRGAAITDAGVRKLTHLKRLRILNLPQGVFSDVALAELVSLPNLELLRFGSPQVTDVGLAHLRRMLNLRFVHIIGSPITDHGLQYFEGLQDLESLYLDGTQVTDTGIAWLLQALPELHVHIDQEHADFDPRKGDHEH